MADTKPDLEAAIYRGAIATAIIGLLPYINVLVLPGYVVGAFVAVRHAIVKQNQQLSLGAGARLGFLSTFLGVAAAIVLFDLIWALFDYQLWQDQNAVAMMAVWGGLFGEQTREAMAAGMDEQAAKSFAWYQPLLQLFGQAIFCGIFGTLSGLIFAKILGKRVARAPAG